MTDAGHNTCKYAYTWIMSADADINIHRTMLYAYDTIKLIRPFKMKSKKLNSDPFPSPSKALTQVVFSQPCYGSDGPSDPQSQNRPRVIRWASRSLSEDKRIVSGMRIVPPRNWHSEMLRQN